MIRPMGNDYALLFEVQSKTELKNKWPFNLTLLHLHDNKTSRSRQKRQTRI